MSEHITAEEIESKLSLVVRKPQEGKTSICITSITNDKSRNIHIVLTMNTLASGMQFFGRMQDDIGPKKIVVFNSDRKTAGECLYAKSVDVVLNYIKDKKNSIKVVVCCANVKRIRDSLPSLFELAADSTTFASSNVKFIIHIDEAHKYIPENVPYIRAFNMSPIVAGIIGYSATPDGIWSADKDDSLFNKILIRDVESELSIMRSENYFGVKDCQHHLFEELDHAELVKCIPPVIMPHILKAAGMAEGAKPREWYGESWYFDLGNELLMMGFLNFVLPTLQIAPNQFSYHFAPSFTRKATHYQSVDIILSHHSTANVIVLNGNGYELFRTRMGRSVRITTGERIVQIAKTLPNEEAQKRELDNLNEPSYMVQKLIQDTPNCPTFITGFTCVNMSVTLINPVIGNFDSVIMSHQHYSRDKLYQLCRFLFNYEKWSPESRTKIKKTQFYSLTSSVVDTCLEYEAHIEKMSSEFAGKSCSLREIQGLEPEEPTEREIKRKAFNAIERRKDKEGGKLWKKFKVYDENDAVEWEKAHQFYESILGKRIGGKSMPKQNENGFYRCSDSKGLGVHTAATFNNLEKEKWSNRFQLKKDCLSYAHVFVGYDNLEDPTEYTIFIKFAELVDTPATREFLAKYYGSKSESESDNEN